MFFSALVAAVVGDSLNANAALLSLNLYNTGATTTKWDAPVQVLANVPTEFGEVFLADLDRFFFQRRRH